MLLFHCLSNHDRLENKTMLIDCVYQHVRIWTKHGIDRVATKFQIIRLHIQNLVGIVLHGDSAVQNLTFRVS